MEELLTDAWQQPEEKQKQILGILNIYGSYIKRRSNLVILNDQGSENAGGELVLCLQETIRNLYLFGIQTSTSLTELHELKLNQAILIYDLFHSMITTYLMTAPYIYVMLTETKTELISTFQFHIENPSSDESKPELLSPMAEHPDPKPAATVPEHPDPKPTATVPEHPDPKPAATVPEHPDWEHWSPDRLRSFHAAILSEQDEDGIAVSLRIVRNT